MRAVVAAILVLAERIVFTTSFLPYNFPSTNTGLSLRVVMVNVVSSNDAPPCGFVSFVSISRFWIFTPPRMILSDTEYWLYPLNFASLPFSVKSSSFPGFYSKGMYLFIQLETFWSFCFFHIVFSSFWKSYKLYKLFRGRH